MASGYRANVKTRGEETEWSWDRFFIVVANFGMMVLWGSVYKSLGVLLPTLTEQLTVETWVIGTVVSAMAIASDVAGLFSSVMENAFGSRQVTIVGTLGVVIGLLLVHMATNVIHIAVALTCFVGPGLGIAGPILKSILGRHFIRHYSMVCGISHTGNAMALLVFAPLMQLFLDTYGWRGAVLLFGGICMHEVACVVRVPASRPQYQQLLDKESGDCTCTVGRPNDAEPVSAKTRLLKIVEAMDLRLLVEFNFWVAFMCVCGSRLAHDFWMVFYVPNLQAKGVSPQTAARLCTVAAFGYIIGTVLFAPFVDRGFMKCSTAVIIANLASTACLVVDPWVDGILALAIAVFIFGAFLSASFTLIDVLTRNLLGIDRLTGALGWTLFLSGFTRLLTGFLPGWIYDIRGSYDLAFISLGLAPAISLIPLIIGRVWNFHDC